MKKGNVKEIFIPETGRSVHIPKVLSSVSAGFPSQADDYIESKLDLNKYLIKHPAATFFVRVNGDSMHEAGICTGDLLVVDKSLEPVDADIVLAAVDGEFTVKRLVIRGAKIVLKAENPDYPSITIKEGTDFSVWGVVTSVIHEVR